MRNDTTLIALALVQEIVLERGERIREITASVEPEEMGVLASCLATLLAAQLEGSYGITGAVEKIDTWRNAFIRVAADAGH